MNRKAKGEKNQENRDECKLKTTKNKETLGHTKHGKKRKWPEKGTKNMQKRNMQDKGRNSRRVASIRKGEMSNQQGEQEWQFKEKKRGRHSKK